MTLKPEASAAAPEPPRPAPPADPNELLMERARQLIQATGRSSILVNLRQDGAEFPNPLRLAEIEQLTDLPQLVYRAHGAGDFDYRVRVGGSFACGWTPLSIKEIEEDDQDELDEDEDAESGEEDEGLDEDAELDASPDAIAERVAQILLEKESARAEAARHEAERLRAIQAPLLAKIEALERQIPAAAPAPASSPELVALQDALKVLQQKLADKERKEIEKEQQSLEDRINKRLDAITSKLDAPKKKKKADPLDHALGHLTRLAAVDSAMQALKHRSAEGDGGSLLEDALKAFEEPLKNVMKEAAKNVEKTAKTTLRQSREQAPSAAGPDVPQDLGSWLQLVFKNQQKVLDVEFVRASLAIPPLGASLERLAAVTTVEQLHRATTDLLGAPVTEAIKKEPAEYTAGILQLCQALARTIHAVKTTPPPAPEAPEGEKEKATT